MNCKDCGNRINPGNNFCTQCGAKVEKDLKNEKTAFDEIREMGIKNILPVSLWFKNSPLKESWARWFLFFTLFPLFMIYFATSLDLDFEDVSFLLGTYFAFFSGFFLYFIISPEKLERNLILKVIFFTLFSSSLFIYIFSGIPLYRGLVFASARFSMLTRLFAFIFGVGFVEETLKALPIFYFFFYKKRPSTLATITFLGCISGFAFGISESVGYSNLYVNALQQQKLNFADYLLIQTARLITLPFLHAIWTGIVSYFIALGIEIKEYRKGLFLAGISISAILHGVYNSFSDGYLGLGFAIFSVLILITYLKWTDRIKQNINH